MLIKITTPASMHQTIWYHEAKVNKGVAECLYAANFLKDAGELSMKEKIAWFDRLIERNTRVNRNTLHVMTDLYPATNLTADKMIEIVRDFMGGIGFGCQPYLIYKHNDSGNPHLHIVSTTVQAGGKTVNMDFIGYRARDTLRATMKSFGFNLDQKQ